MRGTIGHTHAERFLGDVRPYRGVMASALPWTVCGFLAGIMFWSLAGSWNSGLGNSRADGSLEREVASVVPPAPSCIALVLDRSTGQTQTMPCDSEAAPLPFVTRSPGKQDLALLPAGALHTIPPHSTLEGSTVSRTD